MRLRRASLYSKILYLCQAALVASSRATSSSKRGLCFVANSTTSNDDSIWTEPPSALTWYYNYGPSLSDAFSSLSQDEFEFVPMLWGAPSDTQDASFLQAVGNLIVNQGVPISHVLAFNEPDMPWEWGGSNISPATGARVWVTNMVPLQETYGVKVGLPAMSGSNGGISWLKQFLGNCSEELSRASSVKQDCTYDFVPLHWYGNFGGLASHIGEYAAAFPNAPLWLTEYNDDHQSLHDTQSFYNMSVDYLDRLSEIERYAYFGAFRSDVSNVGPHAAMLSDEGRLTDVGQWYLGRSAMGVLPESARKNKGTRSSASAGSKMVCPRPTLAVLTIMVLCIIL